MLKDLRSSFIAVLALTALLGGAYPLAVTGIAQPLLGAKADGDTRLIGTPHDEPGYFQPRPSVTDYSATATGFSNAGPNDASTVDAIRANARAYAEREGIALADVPTEAAMTSASGIDPDISPANARIQARRVARERGLPLERVLRLVDDETHGRLLGVIGERTINIHDLNAAVQEAASR